MKLKKQNNDRFFNTLIMLLAAVPFLALLVTSSKIYPADTLMKLLFVLISGSFLIIYLLSKRKFQLLNIPILSIPLLGLIAITIIGLFFAHNLNELIINNYHWLAALCLGIVLWQWEYDERTLQRWIGFFVISAALVALIGIVQHLFEYEEIIQVAKPASVFVNKNMATQYVMAILPVSLMLFWTYSAKEKQSLIINSICFTLMLTFIIYTQTRAAWLVLLVVLIVACLSVVIFSNPKSAIDRLNGKYLLISLMSCLALIHFNADGFHWFFLTLLDEYSSITDAVSLENTGEARYKLFVNSLYMGWDNLLTGVGPGQWKVYYGEYMNAVVVDDHISYTTRASTVHNGYIQIFAEYGILGLLLTLLGLATLFTASWKLLKLKFSFLNLGVALSALAILTQANLSFSLHLAMPVSMLVFWLVIISKQVSVAKTFDISLNKNFVLMALTPFIFASVFFAANAYTAKIDYLDSRVFLKQKKYNQSFQSAKKAIEKDPYHRNAHVILYNSGRKIDQIEYVNEKIELALLKYPYAQELLLPAAQITKITKNHEKDIEYNLRLANLFPQDATTIKRVGDAYRRAGQHEEMKEYYKQAVILDESLKNHSTIKKFLLNDK